VTAESEKRLNQSGKTSVRALCWVTVLFLGMDVMGRAGAEGAQDILKKAWRAAGGEANLARYRAFRWKGNAKVYAGERVIAITGEWLVEPPARARVLTNDELNGRKSTRLLILNGDKGWAQIDGQTRSMPPEFFSHEREQFYLYYLMRLVPLKDTAFRLSRLAVSDDQALIGLRVSHKEHADVDLFFDRARWLLVKMSTRRRDPISGKEVTEELLLRDHSVHGQKNRAKRINGGILWPARISIRWDSSPYFDLEITEFTPLEAVNEHLFAEP